MCQGWGGSPSLPTETALRLMSFWEFLWVGESLLLAASAPKGDRTPDLKEAPPGSQAGPESDNTASTSHGSFSTRPCATPA